MQRQLSIVRFALVLGALMMIGIGFLFVSGDETWGWILVGAGVVDLMTLPLVMRSIRRGAAAQVEQPPSVDPSYNPYARED